MSTKNELDYRNYTIKWANWMTTLPAFWNILSISQYGSRCGQRVAFRQFHSFPEKGNKIIFVNPINFTNVNYKTNGLSQKPL